MADIRSLAEQAANAAVSFSAANNELKNAALEAVKNALLRDSELIFQANRKDLELSADLPLPIQKRLRFTPEKLNDCIRGIEQLIAMPDPVGATLMATELDEGLELFKVSCPIGVVGIIFESRPDALIQISMLCLKSGNAALLKGGREAENTNTALYNCICQATREAGLPDGWLGLLHSREDVAQMLALHDLIDLIIPRGSNEFVRYIMENSSIPVMGHADGICHCYVDCKADVQMALDVVIDSKAQYVSVCNATETLLVHRDIAPEFLPLFAETARKTQVELVGDEETREYIACQCATQEDWSTEYLDYKLSVKVVDSVNAAIAHINKYGSGHTDAIITNDSSAAELFLQQVDSADVFWNCSTRFADGFRFGFGAEVGISTNKIHARGPVGLDGLLIYKYKLIGHGQTVAPYADGKKCFTHRPINK